MTGSPDVTTSPAQARLRAASGGWRWLGVALACAVAAVAPASAHGPGATPSNVVTLSATASAEVLRDWLTVVFTTTREGPDAATVQAQLRQALDPALAEARRAARPGQVEVQTGGFSVYPRQSPKGGITGWQGSTELIVQGRDSAAISQLVGRIQTLGVGRVGYSLSREARDKVEADVAAEAIQNFRARAEAISRQFGFTGYTLREVAVGGENPIALQPMMARSQAMRAGGAEESLPLEAGKATVQVSVSGSVQLTR